MSRGLRGGTLILVAAVALAGCWGGVKGLPAGFRVADLHVDLPYHVHYRGRSADLGRPGSDVTLASLRAGNVALLVLSLYVPHGLALRRARFSELRAVLEAAERVVTINGFAAGVRGRARPRVIFGVEGCQVLADHADRLPALVRRRVLLYGLVHAYHNDLADSAADPHPGRGGLTPLGRRFVDRVYAAGGLVDLAHASEAVFWQVARIARARGRPLVVSHANARALADHPRNLTDAQLRAVAASGGVVGLMFHAPFVHRGKRPATLDDLARHAAHLVGVMGPSHVALGSDIDGLIRPVAGLRTHAGLRLLVAALRRRGMTSSFIRKLLFENAARLVGLIGRRRSKRAPGGLASALNPS